MRNSARKYLLIFLLFSRCAGTEALEEAGRRFDLVIHAAHVLTMNSSGDVYSPGFVGVKDGRILEVGFWDPSLETQAGEIMDASTSLVLPGLINGHQHAAMSFLRGVADDRDLLDWLHNFIFPAESKNVNPESVYWGTALSLAEMISSGTTTFVDMYYFETEVAEATVNAGMRGILGQTIIDFPAPDYETPTEALQGTREYIMDWQEHELIIPAVAPHAPYTCSPEVLIESRRLADEFDVPLLIHVAETRDEVDQILKSRGSRPVEFLERIGFLADRVIAAHLVWANANEIEILQRRGVGVVHAPESNMKLASGVAPIPEMLKAGVAVGLGTDGPASNNNLDLFQEMDTMAKLHKVFRMDPAVVGARDALIAATSGGARALNLDDQLGTLEKGKRADLIVVSLESPAAVPRYDLYSMVVYALNGSAVDDVMVNGRWLMRDRTLMTLDLAEIKDHIRKLQQKVEQSLPD